MPMTKSEAAKLAYQVVKRKFLAKGKENRRAALARWRKAKPKCKYCSRVLPYEKRRNKFCDHSCAASYNNSGKSWTGPKRCPYCNKFSGYNKFCSRQCARDFQHKKYIERWLAGKVTGFAGYSVSAHVRRYLIKRQGNCCKRCGWNECHPITGKVPIEVHHKDGNKSNNRPNNLELLCPNCHSLTPNFRAHKR